jgi:hypothetical protein
MFLGRQWRFGKSVCSLTSYVIEELGKLGEYLLSINQLSIETFIMPFDYDLILKRKI